MISLNNNNSVCHPSPQAALKLTAGLDHSQVLRPSGRLERPASYRKPTPEVDVGNGRVPRAKAKPKAGNRRIGNGEDVPRKKDKEILVIYWFIDVVRPKYIIWIPPNLVPLPRMPDYNEMPIAATHWLVDQLLKDLQTAKVLPIKMANMKHQDGLRSLAKTSWVLMVKVKACGLSMLYLGFESAHEKSTTKQCESNIQFQHIYSAYVRSNTEAQLWWSTPGTWRAHTSNWRQLRIRSPRTGEILNKIWSILYIMHHIVNIDSRHPTWIL